MNIKKTFRVDEKLYRDIRRIAEDENQSETFLVEQALKLYRDYYYFNEKSIFISGEIKNVFKANMDYLIQNVNNKTNKLLSELAIQNAIQNCIISDELDVDKIKQSKYRSSAVDFLKSNNRVLRLDELVK